MTFSSCAAGQRRHTSRTLRCVWGLTVWALAGCGQDDASALSSETQTGLATSSGEVADTDTASESPGDHDSHDTSSDLPASYVVRVRVTLDGLPPGVPIKLKQGGVQKTFKTDAQGMALMGIKLVGVGQVVIHASHPDARVGAILVKPQDLHSEILIKLKRFDRSDNPDYKFIYPGTPKDQLSCAHCHNNINEQWYGTAHQGAASNPFLHDVYAGTVSALSTEASCTQAGGRWQLGLLPGKGQAGYRCYMGPGALPDLNPHCGTDTACDSVANNFGGCADCHAPGINGQIGGRNLLEAKGTPYKYGVHCDVCHRVESVNPEGAPGVAGALSLLRPSEPPFASFMQNRPLSFGPFMDVSNYEMGAVQRDHFGQSRFCAACHDYSVDVDPKWGHINKDRWPTGQLPVQSTYKEWLESPMNPTAPCGSCHMPPNPQAWNGADLESLKGGYEQSARAGWMRPAGSVRKHTWEGPRTPGSDMLELAVDMDVDRKRDDNGNIEFGVTVKNVGPGHALPTGLPTRSMLLLVKAYCGDRELTAIGGHVVPDFGGLISTRLVDQDWSRWPKAKVGDKVRVLRYGLGSSWIDYRGPGPFGDGTFKPWGKGLANLQYVGESTVIAKRDDDKVILDKPLPTGHMALLAEEVQMGPGAPRMLAGAPGFAFGRVFVDKNDNLNVPSFRAVDIRSDNRIRAQDSFRTTHQFAASDCASTPTLHAMLLYRSFPPSWVRHWRWNRDDRVMMQLRK